MRKEKRGIEEKRKAIFLIANLVLGIIAFGFLISSVNLVSAILTPVTDISQLNPGDTIVYQPNQGADFVAGAIADKTQSMIHLTDGNNILVRDFGLQGVEKYTADVAGPGSMQQAVGGTSKLSQWVSKNIAEITTGGVLDAILSGAEWAIIAYLAGQLLGSMFGLEEGQTKALSTAMAAGFGIGKLVAVGGAKGGFLATGGKIPAFIGAHPIITGIIIGLIVLELMWKSESQKIVNFECYPWEAPRGGNDCEKCNSDLYPCTEYRCKSLGQSCQLLNKGTGEEKCAWVNPKDVNAPIISLWKEVLSLDHSYKPNTAINPPDRGVKIEYDKATDKCIKAFTPLSFGITTDEPAQCKIDYNRTLKYEDMAYYFGGSNIYKYNHTQVLSLPGPDAINAEAPELKNDGTYNLYVRCIDGALGQDGKGNANDALFVFSFCVAAGPDATPPVIEGTSLANNMPFQFGLNQTELEVYVNEPADCAWSRIDTSYENMEKENKMSCSQHVWEMNNQMLYKCKTILTDLQDYEDNIFYFRCKDQPWLTGDKAADRNDNKQGYKYVLKGTRPLVITNVKPEANSTITGYSSLATVNLEIETDMGYSNGDAWCSFTNVENPTEDDYVQFLETGTNLHKQKLDLPEGGHRYYFQCVDLGGNAVNSSTNFKVEIDSEPPLVVRAYKDGTSLRIITDEKSVCSYSTNSEKACNFLIEEATNMPYANSTEHNADWQEGKTYYIKCKDSNERQPPTGCSIVVRTES